MKRFILACLLAVPFATMSAEVVKQEAQDAARKAVVNPETARFSSDYAEIEYNVGSSVFLVACGAVNAKNNVGKYVGEHLYFVTFYKNESLKVPITVSTAHPSSFTKALNDALPLPDNDPKKIVMEGFAQCVVKMLDQPPPGY